MQAMGQGLILGVEVKLYELFLDVDFQALKFNGTVSIHVSSEENLRLDSVGLDITSVKANGKSLAFQRDGDALLVSTGRFSGVLEIEYSGTVPDAMIGIYRAPYDGGYVISTQFEAAHARRLLPCVDNPFHKAEFALTIKSDRDLTMISNMPAERVTEEGGKKTVKFQKTPRMSTYLLYLGIGRFNETHTTQEKIDIVATTVAGSKTRVETAFASQTAGMSLEYFASYYDIPYVLPKLHLIGVPEFAHGAMENWGAITFREVAFHSGKDSSVREKKDVAITVAHEVAHMWFGNLVTMKWWDDLWLNESFATFVSFKAVDQMYPEWDIWQDFPSLTTSAMARDGLMNTHPIEAMVRTPEEIESLTDEITYSKGASILRMIEAYVSEENFKRGIRSYLSEHKYANATGQDLWDSLQKSSSVDVSRVVKEWIGKPGFPLVSVSATGNKLLLEQERFLLTGEKDGQIWPIPITMRINGETRRFLLDKQKDEVSAPAVRSLKLNVDQTGFYRVDYRGDLQDRVWADDSLSAFDRWGLANDAWAFLQSGRTSFDSYQRLVKRFYNEQSYLPALEMSDQLGQLYQISPRTAGLSREYHRSQLKLLESRKDENSMMLRGIVAARLARIDDDYAAKVGSKFGSIGVVEPDMKRAVSIGYARSTNDFEGVLDRYRNAATDEEKENYLEALLSFKDLSLVAMALGLTFTSDVKKQDVAYVPLWSLSNVEARNVLRLWFKTNLERIGKVLEGTSYLSYLLRRVVPIVGIGRVEEMRQYLQGRKLDGADAALERLAIYDRLAGTISSDAN
jgi:tricorn protease interacting factor F2/3